MHIFNSTILLFRNYLLSSLYLQLHFSVITSFLCFLQHMQHILSYALITTYWIYNHNQHFNHHIRTALKTTPLSHINAYSNTYTQIHTHTQILTHIRTQICLWNAGSLLRVLLSHSHENISHRLPLSLYIYHYFSLSLSLSIPPHTYIHKASEFLFESAGFRVQFHRVAPSTSIFYYSPRTTNILRVNLVSGNCLEVSCTCEC